jgi:hypothetical protein
MDGWMDGWMVKYCYNLWAWTAFFSLPIRSCHIITDSLMSAEVKWNVVLHRELAYIRCFGKVVGCSKCHQTYSSFIVSIPQIKDKTVPQHTYRGARGERRYSSYSFTISALDGGERSASRPGRTLPPGKVPLVPIEQEAGWAPEQSGHRLEEKSSCLCWESNLDCPVQFVARHYTDWATPAPKATGA